MEKQVTATREQEGAMALDRPLAMPRGLVERLKNTISTNIGLYEIRMNLFIWNLLRMVRQKNN